MDYLIRDRAFYRRVLAIALPITGQMLINVGINMMDTIMLSSLGEAQISASSLAGNYLNLFFILMMGVGSGASVMTAQYWGHGDMQSFRKTMTLMLRMAMISALVFVAITVFFPRTVLRIYTNEETIIEEGLKYLRWTCCIFIFHGISQPLVLVLRTAGKSVIPLIASIGAFLLNIFINWVLIFGNLGAPRMEIAGSAIGTLISVAFQALFMLGYVLFVDKDMGYKFRHLFMPCKDLLGEFVKFGLPVVCSDFLLGLGMSGISVIGGHIGGAYVAATAIATVVQRLATVYVQGISSAGSVIVGNTLGELNKERAMKEGVTCFLLSIVMGLFGAVVILIVAGPFISIYDISDETREIAFELMKAAAVSVIFSCIGSMLTKGVLRGGGDTRFLMVADIIFLWLVSIPLGALAGLVWHWPAFWIYLCCRVEMPIKCVVGVFRLFSKKWLHTVKFSDELTDGN